MLLENALFLPSYKQDIFAVQAAAAKKDAKIIFGPDSAEWIKMLR